MLTNQDVIEFLTQKPTLTRTGLNKEAGLPVGTLAKVMSDAKVLSARHLALLEPVLLRYGLVDFKNPAPAPPALALAKVLSIVNHKGGVGKTTTTINLGKALSLRGKRVLLIDFDSQGNLSQGYGINAPEHQLSDALLQGPPLPIVTLGTGLALVPSDLKLDQAELELNRSPLGYRRFNKLVEPIRSQYDFILIDCPPGLGIFTYSALTASTGAIGVIQPHASAIKGMSNLLDQISEIRELDANTNLVMEGILIAQMKTQLVVHREMVSTAIGVMPNHYFFRTMIRDNVALQEAQLMGQDIFSYKATSLGAVDYLALADELIEKSI